MELYEKIIGGKEIYSYPFHITKEEDDYYDCVRRICKAFKEDLDKLDEKSVFELNKCLDGLVEKIEKPLDLVNDFDVIREVVDKTIAYLLEGEPSEAFVLLERFLTDNNLHYTYLLPQTYLSENMVYYRIRKCADSDGIVMKQKDLFHIPFQLRHKAASMRYSIPGYPVFYVAGSLELAYRETIKDDSDFMYVKVKGKKELKFVDVGIPLTDSPQTFELFCLFIFFPFIAACAIPVKYPNDVYKPEYAFPQLLTQYVKKHSDFDGICYIPSKLDGRHEARNLQSRDFAIIVRGGSKKTGYDKELASNYQMTRPLRFREKDLAYQRRKTLIPYNLKDYGDPRLIANYQSKFAFLRDRDFNELFYDIDLN